MRKFPYIGIPLNHIRKFPHTFFMRSGLRAIWGVRIFVRVSGEGSKCETWSAMRHTHILREMFIVCTPLLCRRVSRYSRISWCKHQLDERPLHCDAIICEMGMFRDYIRGAHPSCGRLRIVSSTLYSLK